MNNMENRVLDCDIVRDLLPLYHDGVVSETTAYGYKTEEGYKFFVLYSHPSYDYTTGKVSVAESENGKTLVMDIKKPLIAKKHEANGMVENVWLYECGYSSGDNGEIIYEEFDAVEFGGKIVWSMEETQRMRFRSMSMNMRNSVWG